MRNRPARNPDSKCYGPNDMIYLGCGTICNRSCGQAVFYVQLAYPQGDQASCHLLCQQIAGNHSDFGLAVPQFYSKASVSTQNKDYIDRRIE